MSVFIWDVQVNGEPEFALLKHLLEILLFLDNDKLMIM